MRDDVLSQIQARLPSLSKGQRKIAEYILSSYEKAAFLTALSLGKTVQVSESTVVRFACELGYEGYPQMQKALQELVRSHLSAVQRIEVSTPTVAGDDLLTNVMQADMDRIRKSMELISSDAFQGAVNALVYAKGIYVIGLRSSSSLASFLAYYLKYMFDTVHLVVSGSESEVFDQIIHMGPSDALIGISFPRYASATVKAMRHARQVGAATIALTDGAASPLYGQAEFTLSAVSDMLSLVDSLVAPMSVINALLVALAQKREKELELTLNQLETIWEQNHVYEKIHE
ncbi:MAG: MurR/RpiR family transcriptional regulator [Oscillospiraceae bacterium]|nr:MurR/RpiR family transcriptional regulator [Oscillospiraceae bacterium]